MKRILEIDEEMLKILNTICDAALKSLGMAIRPHINQMEAAIKNVEEKKEDGSSN